jgi:hypothetical protein
MNETNDDLWEVVASAAGMVQANLVTGRLASDGIRTRLRYEAVGTIYAITVDGLGKLDYSSTIYCGSPPLPPQRIVFSLYKSRFFC